ncbi:syntaxin-32 isoform X1 [Olea europaea subsp. europaea]|uniref:Syntaxin-32 isoform X1 n=1 Tax=Olea europaea subsp. europaea TaxID=158383 RepID=A0A8S0RSU4_OLEEU|nr:syntaxin-32 isoform X1 [Olea europaea subsp. europaea]
MRGKGANASIRDRTQEFLGIAERVKKSYSSQNGPSSSGSKPLGPQTMAMQSEFNRKASKIGLGIHQTSQKLSKLAKLAKRTSVFDDPTMEIQELTAVIKQDITALNSAVVDLQLLCNSRHGNSNISSDTTTHSTTVVDDLKNRLMSATKEFKEVLTMRTEAGLGLVGGLSGWLPELSRPKEDIMHSVPQKKMALLFKNDEKIHADTHCL